MNIDYDKLIDMMIDEGYLKGRVIIAGIKPWHGGALTEANGLRSINSCSTAQRNAALTQTIIDRLTEGNFLPLAASVK